MGTWILLALILLAAILGFSGLITLAAAIFRLLFWILLAVLVMMVIARLIGTRRATV